MGGRIRVSVILMVKRGNQVIVGSFILASAGLAL